MGARGVGRVLVESDARQGYEGRRDRVRASATGAPGEVRDERAVSDVHSVEDPERDVKGSGGPALEVAKDAQRAAAATRRRSRLAGRGSLSVRRKRIGEATARM